MARSSGQPSAARNNTRATFNILFSNTQTLLPALYGRTPRPDVRPRWQPKPLPMPHMPAPIGVAIDGAPMTDPGAMQGFMAQQAAYMQQQAQIQLSKDCATIIERSLSYAMSEYDFDALMRGVLLDYLLTGRGVPRVKYEPVYGAPVPVVLGHGVMPSMRADTMTPVGPDDVEPGENEGEWVTRPLQYEKLSCELVHWDDFRIWPARSWEETPAIAFKHRFTAEQMVEQFGELGATVPMTEEVSDPDDEQDRPKAADGESKNQDALKRALVWEIWHKPSRSVVFIAPALKTDVPLKELQDPLTLPGFFPIPRPLYSVLDTNSLIPCPEYVLYEDQAKEIDVLTRRINATVKAIKYRGIYNAGAAELQEVLTKGDNAMVAAQNFDTMTDLAKQILMVPIDAPIKALAELYKARDQAKQVIYEVTGLADIIRGATDAEETATAQDLKSRWGSLRIQDRRREVERLVVELLRMKADIMASLFAPETLSAMSGMDVTPEMLTFLRDDGMRNYRIDVETDSMILQDRASDQAAMKDLLAGVAEFTTTVGLPLPPEAAKALLLSAIRTYPSVGREAEDAINQIQPGMMMPMGAAVGGGPMPANSQPQQPAQRPQLSVIPGGMPSMTPA